VKAQVGYNGRGKQANDPGMVEEVIGVAVRSWMLEQLVKVERHQPEMVERAVKEMLAQQSDLRWSVVVGAYLDGEINLGKAAELLGMHRLELQERFIAQSIPVRIGPNTIEEARAELAAIESWNAQAEEAREQ
jgi:predicted HTH domain antitoxin